MNRRRRSPRGASRTTCRLPAGPRVASRRQATRGRSAPAEQGPSALPPDGLLSRRCSTAPGRQFMRPLRPHRREPARQMAPTWSSANGSPRVLVEHPDPMARGAAQRALEAGGYEVLTCGGPHPVGEPSRSCPVLPQQPCPAVRGADVVVSALARDQVSRMVTRRVVRDDPDQPVIVVAPQDIVDRHDPDVSAARLWPLDADGLLSMVDSLTR